MRGSWLLHPLANKSRDVTTLGYAGSAHHRHKLTIHPLDAIIKDLSKRPRNSVTTKLADPFVQF